MRITLDLVGALVAKAVKIAIEVFHGLKLDGSFAFGVMRWLMIGLLVSLAAMLMAVAGVARHIRLERARLRSQPDAGPVPGPASNSLLDPANETDREI